MEMINNGETIHNGGYDIHSGMVGNVECQTMPIVDNRGYKIIRNGDYKQSGMVDNWEMIDNGG